MGPARRCTGCRALSRSCLRERLRGTAGDRSSRGLLARLQMSLRSLRRSPIHGRLRLTGSARPRGGRPLIDSRSRCVMSTAHILLKLGGKIRVRAAGGRRPFERSLISLGDRSVGRQDGQEIGRRNAAGTNDRVSHDSLDIRGKRRDTTICGERLRHRENGKGQASIDPGDRRRAWNPQGFSWR